MPTIAVIFDFDDTLIPDSTTTLLEKYGIDPNRFWKRDAKALVLAGFDPALAYLKLILDNIGPGKPFGNLTNSDLRTFGASLGGKVYPGLPRLFQDLRKMVTRHKNIDIRFYIISGGLQEIIEGNPIIAKEVTGIYACQLAGNSPDGPLKYIKRCVTFTEKTRYLFEINKGIRPADAKQNPYLVNKDVPEHKRSVPLKNMIYVGDGLTDIPCFSLIKNFGGTPFGVFDPGKKKSAKRAFLEFLTPRRVVSIHAPKYGKTNELGALLRAAVAVKITSIEVAQKQAESAS